MHRKLTDALIVCGLVVAGCSGLRSTPASRYEGIMLNARTLGAEQLHAETARDPVVRDYVRRVGEPDYVLVASPNELQLVYYRDSRLVYFHRDAATGTTTWKEVVPLPTPILNVLPLDLRAGTPGPQAAGGPLTSCWSVDLADGQCRTCCVGSVNCSTSCDWRAVDSPSAEPAR
jgi:hypothetical protein